jgi:hypothetical protein
MTTAKQVQRAIQAAVTRHAYLTILIFVTLIAAVGYDVLSLYRPDYFRVQTDLNVRPIDLAAGVRRFEDRGPIALPARSSPDIGAAASRLQQAYDAAQAQSRRLAAMQREVQLAEHVVQLGNAAFLESQSAQMEIYVREKKLPFEQEILKLKPALPAVLLRAGVTSPDQLQEGPDAIAYANLRVKLAELSLASIRAEAAARGYALGHLEEFQRSPQQRAHLAAIQRMRKVQVEFEGRQNELNGLFSRVAGAESDYRKSFNSTLNFFDFLYFSIGGATGANFGDISPNHTFVRMCYAFQICLSIFLLALTLDKVTKGLNAQTAGEPPDPSLVMPA